MTASHREQGPHTHHVVAAIGFFLLFGAVMAALAGFLLLVPGTALDRMWVLNPRAHAQLLPYSQVMGPLFFVLSVVLAVTAWGWFHVRNWAWKLAIVIMCTQIVGDLVNILRGDLLRGGVGLVIASAFLLCLLSARIRNWFALSSQLPSIHS